VTTTINASTSAGLVQTADTSGILQLQTAGTAALTIDTSANVGIGTTSPNTRVQVYKASNSAFTGTSLGGLVITDTNATNNYYTSIDFNTSANNSLPIARVGMQYTTSGSYLQFGTSNAYGSGITNTAMTIDYSGNVGIGTSPSYKLDVAGIVNTSNYYNINANTSAPSVDAGIYRPANGTLGFVANAAERMRIDSSGNLLVGTTTQTGRLAIQQTDAGSPVARIYASSSTFADNAVIVTADRNTTNNSFYFYSAYNNTAAAYKFRVADSGNVTNTNNSYGAISDLKLKENIVDATPKLAQLNQVRVVNYNFIGSEEKQLGVIAQELEQIFPNMVEQSPDYDKDGNDLGTTTKSVKYSVFVPMLIKAIQEQQALITALTARITALESK
jgi:hypothetical protein